MNIDYIYFRKQILYKLKTSFFDLPMTYVSYVLLLVHLFNSDYASLYIPIALGIGVLIKLGQILSKKKSFKTPFIVVFILDLLIALGFLLVMKLWIIIVLSIFVILFILYGALLNTLTYSQLSFTSPDVLADLNKRHKSKAIYRKRK